MKPNEAPQAFPFQFTFPAGIEVHSGATLWDLYAMHAPLDHSNLTASAVRAAQDLPRNATAGDCLKVACGNQAFIAAAYADAMLAERMKRCE